MLMQVGRQPQPKPKPDKSSYGPARFAEEEISDPSKRQHHGYRYDRPGHHSPMNAKRTKGIAWSRIGNALSYLSNGLLAIFFQIRIAPPSHMVGRLPSFFLRFDKELDLTKKPSMQHLRK